MILSEPSIIRMSEDDDTAPTVEYDDEEDSHGTIFRFDLRAVRYVKVWSSISSTDTAVHFSEIAPCHGIMMNYAIQHENYDVWRWLNPPQGHRWHVATGSKLYSAASASSASLCCHAKFPAKLAFVR